MRCVRFGAQRALPQLRKFDRTGRPFIFQAGVGFGYPSALLSVQFTGDDMQQCTTWVWQANALEPEIQRDELRNELVLDRERLGVVDSSVSRTANAPRLRSKGSKHVVLEVPERCSTSVVAIHLTDFASLQRGMRHDAGLMRVAPSALGRRTKLVFGQRSSVALMRALYQDREAPHDYLVSLPRAEKLAAGTTTELGAPVLLVMGSAAVAVMPGSTVHPDSLTSSLPMPQSFRLPEVGVTVASVRELDGLVQSSAASSIRVAGWDEPCSASELPQAGRAVLDRVNYHYAYVPALLEDREPRLVLFYERQDRSVGALISDARIADWLQRVEDVLTATQSGASTTSKRASDRPLSPAAMATPTPPRSLGSALLAQPRGFGDIKTLYAEFATSLERVAKVAATDLTLLILGPSGTGKERLAQSIHAASRGAGRPFVAINCAAIPEALIESELFGHEKGAFTGTLRNRDGAFRAADGGTLLLDEIGDAPRHVQLALLRVLESRRVKAVGADREVSVNVRVIAATSRDLNHLVSRDQFRKDLYYRLNELAVALPALAERKADLPALARTILDELGCAQQLTHDALALIQRHDWPGNLRELRSALKVAVINSQGQEALSAQCFDVTSVDQVSSPKLDVPFVFPQSVCDEAQRLWNANQCPTVPPMTAYERRALQRAAMIYLRVWRGGDAFPSALVQLWATLFRPRWDSSEGSRGIRDVMRVLGCLPSDVAAREWILGVVA